MIHTQGYKVIFLMLISFFIGFTYPTITEAAEKKDKSAKRMQILMLKMQQDMEAEKLALQVKFDAEKKAYVDKQLSQEQEIAAVNNKLAAAEKKNSQLNSDVKKITLEKASVESIRQQTQADLVATKTALTEQKQLNTQAQADLKFNDNQRKTLATNLSDTTKAVNLCETKNTQLHQYGSDLIKLYDNPSTYETAMRKEKFFQLKRVELENILQIKQDNLDESKFTLSK